MRINIKGHRVLVKPDPIEEVTEGGIVLVHQDENAVKAATTEGTVVAVGSTAWKDEGLGGKPWAFIGDRIIYSKFAGKHVGSTDDPYLVLNDEDVLATLEE